MRIGAERNREAEAIKVRAISKNGTELSERAIEFWVKHVITTVFEHFQNCPSRNVVSVALCWPFVHKIRQASIAVENAVEGSAVAVKGLCGCCHCQVLLLSVALLYLSDWPPHVACVFLTGGERALFEA